MPQSKSIQDDFSGSSVSIHDRIFLGEGLFETLRVHQSAPCFSLLHWQRLKSSAQTLGLDFNMDFDLWHEALCQMIQREQLQEGGIKAILTGGQAPRGLISQGTGSQLLLDVFSYTKLKRPLKLTIAPWLRDAKNPVYGLKSINYLESILARRQAAAQGFDEVLFFNTQQHATEASCANLFIIYKDKLMTPALEEGVLPGITRQRVFDYCQEHSICCEQVAVSKKDLEKADAIFLTNSLQGIQPVSSIDGQDFNSDHDVLRTLIQQLN